MPVKKSTPKATKKNSAAKQGRGQSASGVYAALRREILDLVIQPGTLLDETELAQRFGLSRSPVREALIRLSSEGLVQTLRNRSSIVAPFDVAAVPDYLDAVTLIYRLTTRLAAQNRSAAQLAKIKELQREHAKATARDDALEMIRLNHDFHLSIAEAGGNAFFVGWTKSVLDHGQRMLRLYLRSLGDHIADHVLADHLALVKAIEEQDADAAEAAAHRDADIIAEQMRNRFSSRPSAALTLDSPVKRAGSATKPRAGKRG